MYREIAEELGATATGASQVFLMSHPSRLGMTIQYYFVARLTGIDLTLRTGPELSNPAKGGYDEHRVTLTDDGTALSALDLRPPALKQFILSNRQALLTEAGLNPV
jgi:hypothetical protein